MRTTIDVDGLVITYIHDRELRSGTRRQDLLAKGQARLEQDRPISAGDELVLFKAYHACGYELSMLHNRVKGEQRSKRRLSELRRRLLDRIVNENIGLVHEMRRRSLANTLHHDDLISEGMWTLYRAAVGFDPWRGFRFSTYACRSILRAYQAVGKRRARDAEHLNQSRLHFEDLEAAKPPPPDPDLHFQVERLKQILETNQAGLTPVERLVLDRRVLNPIADRPETLMALGEVLDLSKEGVRQIQLSALAKLRPLLAEREANERRSRNPSDDSSPGERESMAAA